LHSGLLESALGNMPGDAFMNMIVLSLLFCAMVLIGNVDGSIQKVV
jgi:hypothetical protein